MLHKFKQGGAKLISCLESIKLHLTTVRRYFLAKVKKLSEKKGKPIVPLFNSMAMPIQEEVGSLLQMQGGHNGKPLDLEATLLAVHLDLAGFLTLKLSDQTTV